MELQEKVVVITGASSGIGLSIAQALAAQGTHLVLAARNADRLKQRAESLSPAGGQIHTVPTDVTKEEDCRALAQVAFDTFGRLDVLVNNAGYAPPASLLDTTEEIWNVTLEVCLKGVYLMTRAVIPTMLAQGGGTIVNISSVAGKFGFENRTAYCAAKWGVHGFTEALRVELGDQGIRAHLICPGAVATPWWDTVNDPQTEEIMARMIQPEEVARAVTYVLTQPEQIHIGEIMIRPHTSPWAAD